MAPLPGGPSLNQDPALTAAQAFHKPKSEIETRHKVISFGSILKAETPEEEKLYSYKHQRADLKVSKGSIPVGFLALLETEEGQPLYLETKDGGFSERSTPLGPLYQVTWRAEREVIGALNGGDGWSANLDDLWREVLAHFERKNLMSEESLDYLDADPFVLFGIDDAITQQALLKLSSFPALECRGATPSFEEWARYLRVEPANAALKWLVEAFAETELPKPWTSYKGIGSIVCYIRADSGQVTWKNPFYDYFRQLRDFCGRASREEVMKVRVNRLLWGYEASRVETEHDCEPLVSPPHVARLCDVFGYEVKACGCLVRNLKAQLKVFATAYRTKQDVELEDVVRCKELLARDMDKWREMKEQWRLKAGEVQNFELSKLANGEVTCINCNAVALAFCLECKDYLCLTCYDSLHSKGARLQHSPFKLVPCVLCSKLPAKLHCTFTDKSLCHRCYAMKHIKLLPPDGRENQPRKIDYAKQYGAYAEQAKQRAKEKAGTTALTALALTDADDGFESVLSTDWHPFYDARGVKYYYNFTTTERMRQSPRRVPTVNDEGAEEVPMGL